MPYDNGGMSEADARRMDLQNGWKARDQVAELKALLKEAADYLDTHKETSICHGSILHRKFKAASR